MRYSHLISIILPTAAALAVVVATRSHAQADLIGDSITGSSNGFLIFPSTARVGATSEFFAQVALNSPDGFRVDFGANDVLITAWPRDFAFEYPFSRLTFTDTSKAFNSVSFITSSLNGFGAGTVSLSGGNLTIAIPATSFTGGTSARYAISTIPEPPSVALLGLGLFVLFRIARRRRAQPVTVNRDDFHVSASPIQKRA